MPAVDRPDRDWLSGASGMKTQIAWADVLVDSRSPDGWPNPDLPSMLEEPDLGHISPQMEDHLASVGMTKARLWAQAEPGPYTTLVTSKTIPLPANPQTALLMEGFVIVQRRRRGSVIVRVTYPDGWRIALASGPYGEQDDLDPQTIWDDYTRHSYDGFVYPLAYDCDFGSAVTHAAEVVRKAVTTEAGWRAWWTGADIQLVDEDRGAAAEFATLATRGSSSYRAGAGMQPWFRTYPWAVEAQQAGFDLDDEDDLAWFETACEGQWPGFYLAAPLGPHGLPEPDPPVGRLRWPGWGVDAWEAIHRLRAEGWTLDALTVLHGPVLLRSFELEEDPDGLVGFDRWMRRSGAADWLSATGSPALASACLTAGIGVEEARQMRAEGTLDLVSVRTLVALQGNKPTPC